MLPSVCLLYVVCQLNRRKRRSGNDPKSLAWWFCPFFFNYFINPHIADFSLLFFYGLLYARVLLLFLAKRGRLSQN